MKRIFDILSAGIFLLLTLPFTCLIGILIVVGSKGGMFFKQKRVGKNQKIFHLYKFRTMQPASEGKGQLTVGDNDPRITSIGSFLRKYKLDEIPQLINIIKGDMSIVGPRPEVEKYVNLYTHNQLRVLTVKPGLTDLASIQYINENEELGRSLDPEQTYINDIMPHKLKLNMEYIEKASFLYDIKLIFRTLKRILLS